MASIKHGNEFTAKGMYIDAINCYYSLAIAKKSDASQLIFNLLYALDKFFETKYLRDYNYYLDQYSQSYYSVEEKFDVVVCVHNALRDVKECISSVIAASFGNLSIIVIDDGSDSDTAAFLQSLSGFHFCSIYRNEKALGYTLAANIGLKHSTRSFVTLLNSDTIVTPFWQGSIFDAFCSDSRIGIVGPLSNTASWQSVPSIFNANGDWAENPLPEGISPVRFANMVRTSSLKLYPKIGFINGFCFTITRKLIDQIGFFDEESFGRGYGEENDYCIRARSGGWLLAVADDCYVYHSQSKSYSHERRAVLSKFAGEMLNNKHGSEPILIGVRSCHHDLQMQFNRNRIRDIIQIDHIKQTIKRSFASKRVGFLLPAGGVGGGSNIIVNEALVLHSLGVEVSIINLQINKIGFESYYPQLPFNTLYLQSPKDLGDIYKDYDALIATLYLTVFWLDFLPPGNHLKLGYYIQDHEPSFFLEHSDEHINATQSYRYNPNLKCFTKTSWNAKIVEDNYCLKVDQIGLSYDDNRFFPPSIFSPSTVVNIIAMVRFETPRRGPHLTIQVLRKLYNKYRDAISITVFGSNPNHHEFGLMSDLEFSNLGIINSEQASSLFKTADIFVDCSHFQAMGLTALECMASGVSVVGTIYGGMSEFITHDYNGYLADPYDTDAFAEYVSRLVDDSELRWKFREHSLEAVRKNPVFSVGKLMHSLFQHE